MENPIELRPVSHEFYTDDDYHGAAFVGAKAADAMWFYRFDSSFIEVRDIFTCQDKVFASLSTIDIRQRFSQLLISDELRIVNVQDAYVGEFHTLVFVVREVPEDRDHVFIWNLLTLQLQLLVSAPRLLTAVSVTAQQAFMVSHRLVKSWGKDRDRSHSISDPSLIINGSRSRSQDSIDVDLDEHHEDDESFRQDRVPIQGNRRQLVILGHRNGWITVYKFTVSLTGEVNCGKITSLATLSSQSAKDAPVVIAGTSEGKAMVLQYDDRDDNDALPVLEQIKHLKSDLLPITSITLESTVDNSGLILAIGQSFPRGQTSHEYPAFSIYRLRLTKPEARLVGYVKPTVPEGESIARGKTLAATVSEDGNGLRIHCTFEFDIEQGSSISELSIVQVNPKELERLDHVQMVLSESGGLLDISPQTNSYELLILYLNGLKTYVNAADISRRQQEEEWAEIGQGPDGKKDVTPLYQTYFPDNSKFCYTEAELKEIEQRREQLGGKLFYDRLLEFVELKTGALYPPRSHPIQLNLWTNIYFNGDLEADNRNCLAYYLLKNQHGDASRQFLREHVIPPKFVDLMNGFWALDHFEFKNAVLYLSRPGLTVDWVEDVIEAICEHASPQLARQFLIAANLDLSTPKFIITKMKALLHSDFTEAMYYQRSISRKIAAGTLETDDQISVDSTLTQEQLFHMLMDHCFLDKPNRKAIHVLSLLTMTEAEESLFIKYCDQHSGLTSTIAQEFMILYYVNHARYMEAIRLHQKLLTIELEKDDAEKFHREAIERRNSRQFGDKEGKQASSMSKSQKRQVLMNRLIAILPAAQKMVLKMEEEQRQKATGAKKSTLSFAHGEEKTLDPTRSVVQSLMDQVDAPLASVKALDLDWITKSLAQNLSDQDDEVIIEEPDDEESTKDTIVSDDQALDEQLEQALAAAKQPVSEAEVMELDDSDDDL
ncbi:hypothetical protein BG006_002405 [Podila minutissima]|uniref:ELYS-like domain-containing protein n=1 Tax=Podila minutissima TaxID=64525 RepID=A0A9P5SNA3_9FUNG|nr:hypothetical protein BG006_002405 [Podila minutissima]